MPEKLSQESKARRTVVKAAAGTIAGLAAASYVKPTVTRLGVPSALAVSGSNQQGDNSQGNNNNQGNNNQGNNNQ